MSEVDRKLKMWAGARLDIPYYKIRQVRFEKTEGYYYSEYTEEPGTDEAWVDLYEPEDNGRTAYHIDLREVTFADLLAEVLHG